MRGKIELKVPVGQYEPSKQFAWESVSAEHIEPPGHGGPDIEPFGFVIATVP